MLLSVRTFSLIWRGLSVSNCSGEPLTQTEPVTVGNLTIAQTLEYGLGVVWYAETIEELLRG